MRRELPDRRAPATPLDLRSPLRVLAGVGPRTAAALAAAGLATVGDLLWHLPRDYEDRRACVPLVGVREGDTVLVRGRLDGLRARRARRRLLVEGTLRDGAGGALAVTWFGQGWLLDRLQAASEVTLHGTVRRVGRRLTLSHPEWAPAAASADAVGLVPVYPEVGGLASPRLRAWIAEALARIDLERHLPEELPVSLRVRHDLPVLADAVRTLHRPPPATDLAALTQWRSPWHARLIYGELLAQQRELARRAAAARRTVKPHAYRVDERARERARQALPFRLTAAQKRVVRELVGELGRPAPMRRLLQGDVGSGKTVVAALLLLIAAGSDLQAAFLAPTELLAEQHFLPLDRLLGRHFPLALLAGGRGSPAERKAIARGQVPLVVGTQALLEEGVAFQRLALVVIDEQHRFGVRQRDALADKGQCPDLLVMSATPIPRSLALAAYGDLDLTVIDELPPGRQPAATQVAPAAARRSVYERLRREVAAGGQAYVVFPSIGSATDPLAEASLLGLGGRLRAELAEVPSAVLHGQLPRGEREAVMEAFRDGRLKVVFATTVIEVGVDVPAATAMVIEGAERFGLAQLHQLRGRVGRGARPAWCVAVHGAAGEPARQRLRAFSRLADGFALAEEDLRQRGPGELLGERQAGLPALRFASLPRDHEWLLQAWRDARELAGAGGAGGGGVPPAGSGG
jgi:ATP-dependent DNA helicase RecG